MACRRWLVGVALVGVVAGAGNGVAAAQVRPDARAIWVQAGLGASSANLGGLAGISVGSGNHLFSARASFVAENFEGGDEETFDVALLYGRRIRSAGTFRPSASAGIAYVKCEECDGGGNAIATIAIVIAALANTAVKAGMATVLGSAEYRSPMLAATGLLGVAGIAAIVVEVMSV